MPAMRPTLSIGVFGVLALAGGCGHSHAVRDATATQLAKDQDDAADAIVHHARAYLDAREKGGTPPKAGIGAQDYALETLGEAAAALRVAGRAERLADDADVDAGRAARVKTA